MKHRLKFLSEWRRFMMALCIACVSATSLFAQGVSVSGTVTDENGEPMPGVNVVIKGTQTGVVTGADGKYTITVPNEDAVLTFSFVGYEAQEIVVGQNVDIPVSLKEGQQIEEVVVVAFATQKKESVIASVTTVKPGELKVPSSNLTTALAGRISGIISYQRSGEPGQDNADFFVRGITTFGNGKADPLILIDGVEMSKDDLAALNTDDIAAFSVMKDANATALYGARGANGVILINTKEGAEGPAKFSIRFEESFSQATRNIELADPISYMKAHNDAVLTRNPLGDRPYTLDQIANTGKGNPLIYPATDWRKTMLRDLASNQRLNANLSGGGKVARYYITGQFSHDNGVLKNNSDGKFDNNINLRRYVLHSNVNINVTKTTQAIVRLHGTFRDYTGPLNGGTEVYQSIMRANPVYFPAYYEPDAANRYTEHTLFGNRSTGENSTIFYANPYADMMKGYKDYSETTMMAQLELKQDLGFILKGLSARGLFNTSRYSYFDVRRWYDPYYYSASVDPETNEYRLICLNERTGKDYINNFEVGQKDVTTTTYFEAALQYNQTFKEDHAVSGLLVLQGRNELRGNLWNGNTNQNELQLSFPYRNIGLSGRVTYGYKSRYFFEANFGYNGSERFSESEAFGFFPSAGLGYIISNENFFKPLTKVISKLKLKATYGLVGNDQIGTLTDRFFYLSKVNMDDAGRGMTFGTTRGFNLSGISIGRYADPNITWETAYKQNYGIELGLFDKFELQVDYFRENRKNILQYRESIPTTMGLQIITQSNIGEAFGSGVDVALDYQQNFTPNIWLTVHGNFTYAHSEFTKYEEPAYHGQPWRSHVGQPIKQEFGYIAERLFIDDADLYNSPTQQFSRYDAGDLKYKDLNMDGIIDQQDALPIGYPTTPEMIYGAGFSFGYFNLDLSAFFQGSARSTFFFDANNISPFVDTDGNGNVISQNQLLKVISDNHWTEENRNPYALWPRLTTELLSNNTQRSTYFMRDGSFIRLKTVELGYTLPRKWTEKLHISMFRVYLSGTNLLTWSKFKLWDVEQGGGGLNYPVQRVFNIGANVTF